MAAELKIDTAQLKREIGRTVRKLDLIERRVRTKILRKAARAAATPVVKELKSQATAGATRQLRRTMDKQVRTLPAGRVEAVAGQSRKKQRQRAVHIHLVDQDTSPHTIPGAQFRNRAGELIRGDLEHPGTTGDEFVERSQQTSMTRSLKAFADKVDEELAKEAGNK